MGRPASKTANRPTMVERMAAFVERARYEDLRPEAVEALKVRVLDALGCALGALGQGPMPAVRAHVEDFRRAGRCTLIGGGSSSPDLAAFHNGALVRYLDFNDSFLAPGETCHPSDNLAPVLAAAEHRGASGRELLAALAVAYQVHVRLSEEAPVRARGFDHTTQGSFAAAAGAARALGLDAERTAHALAIAGTAFHALRVTRTGRLSHWKGLAYPNTAFCAVHAAFLASRGITGPLEVMEGEKGFMKTISGPFEVRWEEEGLDGVLRTILKRHNAEVHSQSAIDAALALRERHGLEATAIESVDLETFDVAYHIIGGGEEGDKTDVRTKEDADHSLPYMLAAALLDGEVTPAQYRPQRVAAGDVQDLLRRVRVRPSEALSRRFPSEMPCKVTVRLRDGRAFTEERADYEGFHTRPMSLEAAAAKFHRLAAGSAGEARRRGIVEAVASLDERSAADLAALLALQPQTRGNAP